MLTQLTASEDEAHRLDESLPGYRKLFHVPPADGGEYAEAAYLAGNSLGLQPKATSGHLIEELADWSRYGVEGHHDAARPWFGYHQLLTGPAARLVGALPEETVVMNSLTVNLHLLMVSFYRPQDRRTRIVIEDSAFPSDSYAVRSHVQFRGLDPDEAVVRLRPRPGEDCLRTEDVVGFLGREGHSVALVLLGGVNYLTGELMDIPAITAAGHAAGATVGWDLAHAAGNVPLHLHEWNVDFAAWCSYKYLNSGPGALSGVFVHQRHVADRTLHRFEGWWSTDATTRFLMEPVSTPPATADAWAISNPPILALGPVRTSLEMFDEAGMTALRKRSEKLTGYLEGLLDEVTPTRPLTVITPRDPRRRGAQLSLRVGGMKAADLARTLRHEYGVVPDAREPDIIRLAPVPLYSTFHDCWRVADALAHCVPEET